MYGLKIRNENNNEVIKVMVEHACQKVSSWGDGYDSDKHNRVQVINITTRKRCSFDYWGSIMEPNQESADGVLSAITCYASDGCAYTRSRDFFDFCSEFGYDTDSRKAEKCYKGCEKADRDLSRVIGDYDFLLDSKWDDFTELKESGLVEVL